MTSCILTMDFKSCLIALLLYKSIICKFAYMEKGFGLFIFHVLLIL